ncbi:ATPase [Fulvimarina endophytica]|uniref:ATPase n=1 Tax=Fulvimarina endophytica TaxID=2293836 RepID=A0A371WZD5_9HYPH|nr:ATP12 family protein [Fulvimarina endophytica]RFC62350.1 ATPase [Fulvimarina endophytica]
MSNNPDILQQMFENPNALRRDLPKRFYEAASIEGAEGAFAVLLDGRPVKTPSKKALRLPNRSVAEAVRGEWEAQGERIDPATMPATRLANTVIDAVAEDPGIVLAEVPRYAETDLLFYRAGHPDELVERQRRAWDPLLDWAQKRLETRFVLTEGVMHVAQPPEALSAFAMAVEPITDPWTVAGLQQATTLTGSAILALALYEGRLGHVEAWDLSRVDEAWNIERWGRDEEADRMAAFKKADLAAAALFMGRG